MIRSPGKFYDAFNPQNMYGLPMAFAAVHTLIGGVLFGLVGLAVDFELSVDKLAGLALAMLLFGFILYVGYVVRLVIAHGLAVILDGKGATNTVEAMSYPTVLTLTFALIPLVNLVAGLYGMYLQVKGMEAFHEMSIGKAAVVVVVSGILSLFGTIVVLSVFATFLATLIGFGAFALA